MAAPGHSPASAAREAYEEAGLDGPVDLVHSLQVAVIAAVRAPAGQHACGKVAVADQAERQTVVLRGENALLPRP